jgi:hypothetical protein
VLETGDVLDGEVDEEADDAGEDPDGEAEGPFEDHVPDLVSFGSRPPVLIEEVILYNPGSNPKSILYENVWV